MKNLSDAEIIEQVEALDAEVQALADSAQTTLAQFAYSQAASSTAQATLVHRQSPTWGDLSRSYRYGFHLREAARKLKIVNKMLSRRANRLANAINPPGGREDRPDAYPHTM